MILKERQTLDLKQIYIEILKKMSEGHLECHDSS
jgi:hypothetical protein